MKMTACQPPTAFADTWRVRYSVSSLLSQKCAVVVACPRHCQDLCLSTCRYTRPNGSPRLVAVKKLHAHLLKTPAEVDQFVAEAALLRKFHHP